MRALTCLLIVALLAAPCRALLQQENPDDRIYDEVRRRLANDPVVKGGALEVEVRDGVVTLRGKVRDEKQRLRAERVTRRVKGVKKVINELRVSTAIE